MLLVIVHVVVDLGWVFLTLDVRPHIPSLLMLTGWFASAVPAKAQQNSFPVVPTDVFGTVAVLAVAVMVMGTVVLKLLGWIGPRNSNGKTVVPICPATAEMKVFAAEFKNAIIEGNRSTLEPYIQNQMRILDSIQRMMEQRHTIFEAIIANQGKISEKMVSIEGKIDRQLESD